MYTPAPTPAGRPALAGSLQTIARRPFKVSELLIVALIKRQIVWQFTSEAR